MSFSLYRLNDMVWCGGTSGQWETGLSSGWGSSTEIFLSHSPFLLGSFDCPSNLSWAFLCSKGLEIQVLGQFLPNNTDLQEFQMSSTSILVYLMSKQSFKEDGNALLIRNNWTNPLHLFLCEHLQYLNMYYPLLFISYMPYINL